MLYLQFTWHIATPQPNYVMCGIWHSLNLCLYIENQQLMPILETLYNASRRTSNEIYMLLIILLILSQDSSVNASIHKMVSISSVHQLLISMHEYYLDVLCIGQILPGVPWYKEHLLHQTSLGSLMVIILIRTVQYNLSKLRVWLRMS